MQKFWALFNHRDAVLLKLEIAKGLAYFTQENTRDLREDKKLKLEEISKHQKE